MYYDLFARYVRNIKRTTGNNYIGCCPFHNDKHPSFSFNAETGLFHCFACGASGNAYEFAKRVGEELPKSKSKAKSRKAVVKQKKPVRRKKYDYCSLDGKLLYEKTRTDFDDGSKTFFIDWRTSDKKLVLYNLISFSDESEEVWVAEGEKCADALIDKAGTRENVSILAYSASPYKEFLNSNIAKHIKNKRVIVFADNDEVGKKKASEIVQASEQAGASEIRKVEFSEFPKAYDVADFLETHSIDEALSKARIVSKKAVEVLTAEDRENLKTATLPKREFIDNLWNIPRGVLAVIAGCGSVGKGLFLIWNSLRWLENYNVAYITAEDDIDEVKRRMQAVIQATGLVGKKLLAVQELENTDTDYVLNMMSEYADKYEIIILDPLSFILESENDNSVSAKFVFKLQKLCREKNVNIFLLHHLRKGTGNEKISTKFDMLDRIRGAGSLHNNARYVLYIRRNKKDKDLLDVFNLKNSYYHNRNDYEITGLLNVFDRDKKKITLRKIELNSKGETELSIDLGDE